ncbi:hypothetical protein [Flagellimonas sp. CMM7]|uniref:hypothetical protein n=1 Tax=Flagellimonas sp. CMM7 TaxID=2654676 RepID=UPI0013D425B2|nr:hypothetical protein [Flagellimonas sp. CMM7]UII81660.1 hypothetical protein LV704_09130 [Flagellimonas sp. CMM7]
MKSRTILLMFLSIMIFGPAAAQNERRRTDRTKERTVAKEIDKTDRTVEQTNAQIDSTTVSIENTIEGTKETIDKVGKILFGSKEGKTKSKNIIVIQVHSVEYGDENLSRLQEHIKGIKSVKKVSKTFANNNATISVECKKTADDIWQEIPQNLRQGFTINSVSENTISLKVNS